MPQNVQSTIESVYHASQPLSIKDSDRFVIFSDLHMGNGGSRDDFAKNGDLFRRVLAGYYLKKDFGLILNGDVEDLLKFPYRIIRRTWDPVYMLYNRFKENGKLWKTIGNHDYFLDQQRYSDPAFPVLTGLRLNHPKGQIFVFHGHQADPWFTYIKGPSLLFHQYFIVPLNLHNWEVPYNSRARYNIEKSTLDFSSKKRIISLIGHTHRPLFLSMSKIEFLRARIDELCRLYLAAKPGRKSRLATETRRLKVILQEYSMRKYKKEGLFSSPYGQMNLHIPALFNSGCCIGKRGITALEIRDGKIMLVQWYNAALKPKKFLMIDPVPEKLPGTRYYRNVLNHEQLDYIFTRVKLLA